jgi:peptidoglycan/LPS O-acetylase OafA/YrhL
MHFLGVISYSIYMTHFIILTTFMTTFGPLDTWSPAIFGLLAGTTVAVSIGAHVVLEVPARDAIRGLRRLRRVQAGT